MNKNFLIIKLLKKLIEKIPQFSFLSMDPIQTRLEPPGILTCYHTSFKFWHLYNMLIINQQLHLSYHNCFSNLFVYESNFIIHYNVLQRRVIETGVLILRYPLFLYGLCQLFLHFHLLVLQ